MIVLFDGENKSASIWPHLVRVVRERGRPMSAQADSDLWMEAWHNLEAFIVGGAVAPGAEQS